MIKVDVKSMVEINFLRDLSAEALRKVADTASEITVRAGEFVARQHDEASTIQFLRSGAVQFFIEVQGVDDLLVGTLRTKNAMIGWSVFRPPYRYTVSVRAEVDSRVLRIPRSVLLELIESDARLGFLLLRRTAGALADRLEQTRDILVRMPGPRESAGA